MQWHFHRQTSSVSHRDLKTENQALSLLKRHYCQMQFPLQININTKLEDWNWLLWTICFILTQGAMEQGPVLCIRTLSQWCGGKFAGRYSHQKSLFQLQWQSLGHIARNTVRIESGQSVKNRESLEMRF